ncbi:GEVED domain-containing protein [Paenarthrobacter sp. AT5]|uniref:DUF7507 domain-containing protein n=1 Tax=Paenarthrobacter TaxID=1742992 RepID=UPI001F6044BE|nr:MULTISPECIES: GEVED domain-containing protein [Paenarthrobacter]WOC61129.1 GEVED domain-containing protein [Paenarthrobacter sp. AT5]
MFKSTSKKARAFIATLVVLLGILASAIPGAVTPARAYQVAINNATVSPGQAILTMPGSNLTTTYNIGGLTGVVGGARMDSRGYVASDYQQGIATNTPGVEIVTELTNNCPASGTCSGLGTLTMSFNQPVRNPVLNIAGLGGHVYFDENDNNTIDGQSQHHAVLNLATPGLSLTKLSGGNLAVSGNSITNTNHNSGVSCTSGVQTGTPDPLDAQASAGCGSVRINGVVTSVTFNVTGVFVPVSSTLPGYTENDISKQGHNQDNYVVTMTVPQDFGDAPASYDQSNAARAILSDVALGPNVTEDNALVANGTSSPNASASATLDQNDDGVTLAPFTAGTSSYSTTVAITGASKAGTVCGWIDFNKNGRFDNPAERACATFAAGATQATLNWTGLSTVTAGDTYARFRVGYNSTQTQVPIGASDSGEVEDYIFTISPAIVPAPSISLVKSVNKSTMVAGETATYSFTAQNTGNVTLTGVVINETQFSGTGTMSALSYTWPGLPGILLPGQTVTATATYVISAVDVTSGLLTNTAMVTGNPPIGNPVTASDDAEVPADPAWTIKKTASVNGSGTAVGQFVNPGDTITYTVTATSVVGQISGIVLTDNLAGVLNKATFVNGSALLTIGSGAPTPVANPVSPSTTLSTAPFTLPAGKTATLQYSVTVNQGAWNSTLINTVTGSAAIPPQQCATGSGTPGADCTTTHRTPAKVLIEKIGESSASTWVPMDGSSWAIHDDASGTPGAVNTAYTVAAIVGQTGQFQLEGIQPGVYWLEETAAPVGFNLLAEPVQFTIAADGSVSLGQGSGGGVVTTTDANGDGIFLLTVKDVPALKLPESGGIGWWPFTMAGSALLLFAVVLAMPGVRGKRKQQPIT